MKRVWNQHFLLIDAGKVALMPRFARDQFFFPHTWTRGIRLHDTRRTLLQVSERVVLVVQVAFVFNAKFVYYFLVKIYLRFWLAIITWIIHHNQLLLTKFGRILRYWTDDVNLAAKLPYYWTVSRENLRTSLSCFGSDTKWRNFLLLLQGGNRRTFG